MGRPANPFAVEDAAIVDAARIAASRSAFATVTDRRAGSTQSHSVAAMADHFVSTPESAAGTSATFIAQPPLYGREPSADPRMEGIMERFEALRLEALRAHAATEVLWHEWYESRAKLPDLRADAENRPHDPRAARELAAVESRVARLKAEYDRAVDVMRPLVALRTACEEWISEGCR
jgi:hypothetical protein